MNVYNYDPISKVFTGISEADLSPLEEDVYLVPANATLNPVPPFTENQYALWTGEVWEIKNIVTPVPTPEQQKELCKGSAKMKLQATDWSQYNDVADVLLNKAEFDAYRSAIRALFLNPIADPDWPTEPTAVWKE